VIGSAQSVSADADLIQGALDKCTSGILSISKLEEAFYADNWHRFDSNRKDILLEGAFWPLLSSYSESGFGKTLTEESVFNALHIIDDAFERRNEEHLRIFVGGSGLSRKPTIVIAQAESATSWKAKFLWCTIISNSFFERPAHYPAPERVGIGGIKGVDLAGPLGHIQFSNTQSAEAFLWATVWFQSNDEPTTLSGGVLPPYTYIRTQTKYDDAETRRVFSERLIEMVR
jgi:hypothetical protein